jgi:hypothetical protein
MIFEAKNGVNGVSIEGQNTSIKNITGGVGESEGVVLIEKEKAVYLPNNSEDFRAILDFLIEFLPAISTCTTMPSPTWASDIAQKITKLEQIKQDLK